MSKQIEEEGLTCAYLLGKSDGYKQGRADQNTENEISYDVGYENGRADAIEFISDKLIYPLLDECDRGLWEHISYIELAEEWIRVLNDNPYPKVKNHTEARKRDLRQWFLEKLKEQKNEEI